MIEAPKQWMLAMMLAVFLTVGCSMSQLPTATPESQGVSSRQLTDFVNALATEVDAVHSVVIVRHGHVIAQGWWDPFRPGDPHMLYSLSKSFTSTAIGMASDEGLLSVEDAVVSFFPQETPPGANENLKAMRIKDLLTMTTGHTRDTLGPVVSGTEGTWAKRFLTQPVEREPGTHFVYNSGATYMLSAILQKVTGQTLIEYLTPRLFEPLGIENPTWETNPEGINTGGWGLSITTMDIAKFGQLYLQGGEWRGRRLISERWVNDATSAMVPNGTDANNDWNQGYGYQFWRSRHNTYRADGAFGQYCVVLPQQDVVVAITSGTGDMASVLRILWQHLLPAMHDAPLPADDSSHEALVAQLSGLRHATVDQSVVPRSESAIFRFEKNDDGHETLDFIPGNGEDCIVIRSKDGEQTIRAGHGRWVRQEVAFPRVGLTPATTPGRQAVAASGGWVEPDRYAITAWLNETPFRVEMELRFEDETETLTLRSRVLPNRPQWVEFQAKRIGRP